ncbi:TIGR00296 family protein [Natronoarchaeum mannanilyticum]|uniref:TIGR00296 family protein n=2 Tax=Natronoarchaeum mannanilyticum TaxID=926360 RepID=A0AAV3T783_9EURY
MTWYVYMSEAQSVTLSYEDGARAVELAREAVESYVQNGSREQPGSMREAFYARTGAYVRLQSTRGRGSLRGCAGAHQGGDQLGHVIVDAAIRAASDDSCGSEVRPAELSNITVSVCAVTNLLLTDDPIEDLELGRHGVVVDAGSETGWLYPTVPVENNWTAEEYLGRTCRKAGLPPQAWQREDVMVTLFEGQTFREREPEGSVEQLKLE